LANELGYNNKNSIKSNLKDISERFLELREGVNEFDNSNKSLTTDKYNEYLMICNQLGEQFPTLIKGYDD